MAYIFRITITERGPRPFEGRGKVVRTAFVAAQHHIPELTVEWIQRLSDALDDFLPQVARRPVFIDATWNDPNGRFSFYCKRVKRA